MNKLDVWDELNEQKGYLVDDLIQVSIDEDPNKVVKIGLNLYEEDHQHLTSFLCANANIFAWPASNMLGIDLEVMVHQLNVDLKHCLVIQKNCSFSPKR